VRINFKGLLAEKGNFGEGGLEWTMKIALKEPGSNFLSSWQWDDAAYAEAERGLVT
jgi:hypothetical protein